MYARMNAEGQRLEWLGLTHNSYYRQMLQRIAGKSATPQEFAALRTLTDLVEPVKDYAREQTAASEPTSAMALNRVVDAVPLESDEARRFDDLVNKYLAASCHDESAGNELRAQLVSWRDNDDALQPLVERSFLVKEIAPVSQELSVVAKIGVEAMDYLILSTPSDPAWRTDHSAALADLSKPKAQLLLMPLPSVQKLVDATGAGSACGKK